MTYMLCAEVTLGVLPHQVVQQSYTADKSVIGQLKSWGWMTSNHPLQLFPFFLAPSLSHFSSTEICNLSTK